MPSRACLLTDLGARPGEGVADWDLEAFLLRLEADGSLTRLRARAAAYAAVGAARTTHPHPRTPGPARNDNSRNHQDHIAAEFGTANDDVAKRFRPPLPPLEPASPLLLPGKHTPADPDADDAAFVDAEESLDDATSAAVATTASSSPRPEAEVAQPPPEPDLEPDLAFSARLGLFEPSELGTLAAVYSSSSLALSSSSSSGGLPAVGSSSTLAGLDDGGSTAASSELEDWDRWTSSNTEDGASTSTDGEWLSERDRDVVGPTTSAASTVASRWGFNGLVGRARAVTTADGYGGGDVSKGERGCGVAPVAGRTGSGGGQQGSVACAGSCDSLVGLDLEADVDADRRLSEEEEHDAVVNDDDLRQFMAELARDEADGEETSTGVGVCGEVTAAGPEQGGQPDGRHQERRNQQEDQKEQQDEQQALEQQQHQQQKHEQQEQQQMQHHQQQPQQHGNVAGRGGRAATSEARSAVLEGWRLMMNRSTRTMHYCSWVRDPGSCGGTEYRGRLVVRGLSPEIVRDFLLDEDYRAEWDENRLVSETLEEWDERGCTAVRWVRRLPFFLKNREYVVARRVWNPLPRTFFCISRLLARHPAAPIRNNAVRVSTFYSSWRLRSIPWHCAVSSAGGGAGPDTGSEGNGAGCGEMAVEVITHHEEESGLQKDLARMGVARSMWSHIQRMENALRAYAASGRNARHQLPVFLIQADARVDEVDALAAAAVAEAGTAVKQLAVAVA